MTQWPPTIKHDEKVPRRVRAWNFTADGPFWGAVLTATIMASVIVWLLYAMNSGTGSR